MTRLHFWPRRTARRTGRPLKARLLLDPLEDRTLLSPAVVAVSPVNGLIKVGVGNPVTATFDLLMNPDTITTNTFQLRDSIGNAVPATVSYDSDHVMAIVTPKDPLAYVTTYTATIKGGSSGVLDRDGNPMSTDYTWSFTTADVPAKDGQWSQPIDLPIVGIHMALLTSGKVLMWEGEGDGGVSAIVWDPVTGASTAVPNNIDNIFCAGFSFLPDGKLLVMGGWDATTGLGLPVADIFNPDTMTWSRAGDMVFNRYYGTATTLPDGRILATSGRNQSDTDYIRTPEVYDPGTNTWTALTNATATFSLPNYPFIYVLPNGRVLDAGADEVDSSTGFNTPTMLLNLNTQTWTTVDPNPIDGGSSVQYLPGKIMKAGSSYNESSNNALPSSANTYVLDMTQAAPAWQKMAPMAFARGFHNLTLLPNGEVLATGGEKFLDEVDLSQAVYPAECWDPDTLSWTTMASGQVPRLYHSTGLLLPDGRVLIAGGGRDLGNEQANELNAEFYSPPYLFNGPRPTITSTPSSALYGSSFFVQTPDAADITAISLVGMGAVTHQVNFNQRFVPLSFQQINGKLLVQAPADANLAPPGNYMLFISNGKGVPSVASIINFAVPTVGAVTPLRGASGVSTSNPQITATFNVAMNAATITTNTFRLLGPGTTVVSATVTYNATTRVATLTPSQQLLSGAVYTALLAGGSSGAVVKDASGKPLPINFTWTFTTAPMVGAVSPAANATLVNTNANVTAMFNEAMDPTTITGSTFELFDSLNQQVAATVTYDPGVKTAVLVPAVALGKGTTYSAVLVGGSTGAVVKDAAGNPLASSYTWSFTTRADAPNPIVAENQLPGAAPSDWDISGAGDPNLQGFATDISVNRGQHINFKINTISTHYRLDIYRMGYYAGKGARLVTTIDVSLAQPQVQPGPITDPSTGLNDYATWAVSASWAVPANAVSGIYFAKLVGEDGKTNSSHIVFIVRDDASTSDLLFQTNDTTWQAYNSYGGFNFNGNGDLGKRAFALSYNRPFNDRASAGRDGQANWVFWGEYPMVRWLEANGYNVSYFTGVDAARSGAEILRHKVYLTAGHDEYWSAEQRANIEAARTAGVNLAFFTGDEGFWKTRWLNTYDGTDTPFRTLVSYKETLDNAKIDPLPDIWTGSWRDPRFSPPADGGRPENAVSGTLPMVAAGADFPGDPLQIPALDSSIRFWRRTSVAALATGQTAALGDYVLGYQWDEDLDNGFRPAGAFDLSTTFQTVSALLQDYGSSYAPGAATHSLTLYKSYSGALVFGAGTVQWSWGLDGHHDGGSSTPDVNIQQATVNLLADMGVQPASLQVGLVAGTASTDRTPPTSTITALADGFSYMQTGATYTTTGTATDAGGGVVASVEVSVDGGVTWHPATGREGWTYTWTPAIAGTTIVKSRAVDDSGNLESPSAGRQVVVLPDQTTPPQIINIATSGVTTSEATITWTTDENSDSTIRYGTAPQSLDLTASDATLVTAHSIALTGLTSHTTYYYRVTSADKWGNTSTAPREPNPPASFTTQSPTPERTFAVAPDVSADSAPLTMPELEPVIEEAIREWQAAGADASQLQALRNAQFEIADMPATYLGWTYAPVSGPQPQSGLIVMDRTAQGFGWYIGPNLAGISAFETEVAPGEFHATTDSPALRHMDLLTVVAHELGHVVGLPDISESEHPAIIMDDALNPGVRRIPTNEFQVTSTPVTLDTTSASALPIAVNRLGASSSDILFEQWWQGGTVLADRSPGEGLTAAPSPPDHLLETPAKLPPVDDALLVMPGPKLDLRFLDKVNARPQSDWLFMIAELRSSSDQWAGQFCKAIAPRGQDWGHR